MKHVEVFTWLMPPPEWTPKAKPYKSRWKMTVEEASQHGALEPVPGSMEIRNQPETREEISANLTSAWQKRPVKPSDTGGE